VPLGTNGKQIHMQPSMPSSSDGQYGLRLPSTVHISGGRIKSDAGGLARWKSKLGICRGEKGEKFSRSYSEAELGALSRREFLTNRNGGGLVAIFLKARE
jgi:hypothetical protein